MITPGRDLKEFMEAERYARKNKLNIWGDPELTKKYLRLKSEWGQYRSKISSSLLRLRQKNGDMWQAGSLMFFIGLIVNGLKG